MSKKHLLTLAIILIASLFFVGAVAFADSTAPTDWTVMSHTNEIFCSAGFGQVEYSSGDGRVIWDHVYEYSGDAEIVGRDNDPGPGEDPHFVNHNGNLYYPPTQPKSDDEHWFRSNIFRVNTGDRTIYDTGDDSGSAKLCFRQDEATPTSTSTATATSTTTATPTTTSTSTATPTGTPVTGTPPPTSTSTSTATATATPQMDSHPIVGASCTGYEYGGMNGRLSLVFKVYNDQNDEQPIFTIPVQGVYGNEEQSYPYPWPQSINGSFRFTWEGYWFPARSDEGQRVSGGHRETCGSPTATPTTGTPTPGWTPTPTATPAICVGNSLNAELFRDDNANGLWDENEPRLVSPWQAAAMVNAEWRWTESRHDTLPEWTNLLEGDQLSDLWFKAPADDTRSYRVTAKLTWIRGQQEWVPFIAETFPRCEEKRVAIGVTLGEEGPTPTPMPGGGGGGRSGSPLIVELGFPAMLVIIIIGIGFLLVKKPKEASA